MGADDDAIPATVGVFAGLALWLVPHPGSEAARILHHEMEALRSGFYPDSPSFKCHATLISGVNHTDHGSLHDIVATTESAIRTWREQETINDHDKEQTNATSPAMSASFQDVTTRGSYFQCILLALQAHNNHKLMSLNQHMRLAFKLDEQPAFFPHISLLYADLTTEQALAQIGAMERRGVFHRLAGNSKEQPESQEAGVNFAGLTKLTFLEVQLYDCNGSPDTWKLLHTFPLFR